MIVGRAGDTRLGEVVVLRADDYVATAAADVNVAIPSNRVLGIRRWLGIKKLQEMFYD